MLMFAQSQPNSDYSRIEHLVKALFLGRWERSHIAMFTAYFDASGSPDRHSYLSVAGFVAPADQWISFEKDWRIALDRFGVKAMHMKDFAHSTGEFKLWKGDEKRRRAFLSLLIGTIKSRVHHSFAATVDLSDYRLNDAKYCLSETHQPLALAGCACIKRVLLWADKWKIPKHELLIVFEDGDKHRGNLMLVSEYHLDFAPHFMKKSESVAFQASDMLAYESFLASPKVIKEPGKYSIGQLRNPLKRLYEIHHGQNGEDWGVIDNPDMELRLLADGFPLRQQ